MAAAHPLGVTVVEDHYDPQEFYSAVTGLENEPEQGSRCTVCYRLRMRRAAQYASENGFDWFTTTLSISPHKDAKRINAIGQELEAEFGVKHLPSDFKSTTAICAACNFRRNTACTGRITAGASSARRPEALRNNPLSHCFAMPAPREGSFFYFPTVIFFTEKRIPNGFST